MNDDALGQDRLPPQAGTEAPATEASPADLKDGAVLLPRFIRRRSDGLYVDPSLFESELSFQQFVERVFAANALFSELDYPLFLSLLYQALPPEAMVAGAGGKETRLARDIVPFNEERRKIYHGVKASRDGSAAEYLFEPVSIERSSLEAVFGDPLEDGSLPILRYDTKTISEPTRLDPDEFIAAMWGKGIRFGIDMDAVRLAIAKGTPERLEIAHAKPSVAGTDASINEQTDVLHRDDTPTILPDGRIDLTRFNNHFPQVSAGTRLLKKIPRVLGELGFNVLGAIIAPAMPKDFDIETVAGAGTRVERSAEGEFIVAAITGFVNIDTRSNAISVSEKIVNRQGISLRTTGDLFLSGSDFEEHGEVQERRQVKGHNMSFLADVFGEVISDGGAVHLKGNLAGGSVRNPAGSITIERSASRATVEARDGEITMNAAENSLIIGSKVRIKRAVNCEILAEEVDIESCEGCAVAGRRVTIGHAANRKEIETVVSVRTPDPAIWDMEIESLEKKLADAERVRASYSGTAAQIAEQPEVKKFLTLQQKIQAREITISAEQESGWKAAQARFAAVTRQLNQLAAEVASAQGVEQDLASQVETLREEKRHALDGLSCKIGVVSGETIVRTMRVVREGIPLEYLSPKEIHQRLRAHGTADDRLFSSSSGSLAWSGKDSKTATS
ncbi:hypothetical protein GALL_189460 [mine drainage metagenome]|uniref:Flagellar Assembly Protein A N-terminal region domain-containing protein n=1 Tax=mine drainage metagenome TaxID=410659 RepID=A0A1J5RRV0_9ZZZZ